ncbi:unnamed protein product [Rotaria magnacalcarata]|uniref:Uncharacterized protein n=1 Tax=Rotaria magnacalcarata TaxID=392030 RepID=A0A820N8S2_9BILA|nr:unnamed protein product [Rotaria magnacalcarata]CAF2089845.1 unnamed protein product [Rotaria magnacalcarata]CAF4310517.1 unnamed protein product [Rotaria magnacalcarata]CAF4384605.1 unnamed protein product [Rotaria magnacalcarata]CAF4453669.1 unnamed protein product [Rotaria magnacalcarata]
MFNLNLTTRTGKTSFAKSLPGHYNYFDGEWALDVWKNFASYSIYDNIGWDEFEKIRISREDNYSPKKEHFSYATDETETVLEIECKQPGKQEGPLTRKPITFADHCEAKYWKPTSYNL